MIPQYATFIDAGCLRSCAQRGTLRPSGWLAEPTFAPSALGQLLKAAGAQACPESRLLRHYFYDGAKNRFPSDAQAAIAKAADFEGRWGKINLSGVQKGVDTMIAVDMAMMAAHGVIQDVIFVGSDYDIHPGFVAAKSCGARAHLIDLELVGSRPCRELVESADSVIAWTPDMFSVVAWIDPNAVAPEAEQGMAIPDGEIELIAANFAADLNPEELAAAAGGRENCVARGVDYKLLACLSRFCATSLTHEQKNKARKVVYAMSKSVEASNHGA